MDFFGLADCNNFYCSCERVFHPDLRYKPVIVLSNNDGCVVARSEESKKLGIKMGVPFYQIRELVEKNNVAVFSSNYNLYGDISRRVMSLLSSFFPKINIYSIDEAFIDLSEIEDIGCLVEISHKAVKSIYKGVGIPISLGIAPTKTLAKMASVFAKKHKGYKGVCVIDTDEKREKALKLFPVGDVWGIGRKHSKRLEYNGIKTAWDFTQKSEGWVRREMSITGLRTWKELRGVSCIEDEDALYKKSICTSRSFPNHGLNRVEDVEEAVANFAAQCSKKLREQHTVCQSIIVFAYTSRFRDDMPRNYIHEITNLDVPTNDIQEIVSKSVQALKRNWKTGTYYYKKAGVVVCNISEDNAVQCSLFDTVDREKQSALSKIVDEINLRNGHDTVRVAVQGYNNNWHIKNEYVSKQYTTNIKDILVVKA
ncbi:MAG: Y-family DNA polymerase [Lentimicrobiaceae bacterium]|nr:Y-family DNA polymerase [Lentimicrobiaceae bacterium]